MCKGRGGSRLGSGVVSDIVGTSEVLHKDTRRVHAMTADFSQHIRILSQNICMAGTPANVCDVAMKFLSDHKIEYLHINPERFVPVGDPFNTLQEDYWVVPYEYNFEVEIAYSYIQDASRSVMFVSMKHGRPHIQNARYA